MCCGFIMADQPSYLHWLELLSYSAVHIPLPHLSSFYIICLSQAIRVNDRWQLQTVLCESFMFFLKWFYVNFLNYSVYRGIVQPFLREENVLVVSVTQVWVGANQPPGTTLRKEGRWADFVHYETCILCVTFAYFSQSWSWNYFL